MATPSKGTVVFLNPPGPAKLYRSSTCTYVSKANYLWQPQDFITLSAHVPPEYDLAFIDCSIAGLSEDEGLARAAERAPVAVVAALSSIVADHDLAFLARLRKRLPEARILALGDLFLERAFWEQGLEHADGLILNPMDNDLGGYLRSGSTRSGTILLRGAGPHPPQAETGKQAPRKVSIGIPHHELFLSRKYRFPFAHAFLYGTVSTQFGCPFQCQYCTQSKIPVIYRDHREVLGELHVLRRLGVRELFFGDPSFGFPRENAEPVLSGMAEGVGPFGWSCYANPGLIDGTFLRLMKRAGCHTVIIGIEDADMEMLQERYRRNLSRSRLEEFCRDCRQLGIRVCGDFIIGLNSDERAVDRMVEFARQLRLDYASFNLYIPLFGSGVRERLVREGRLDPAAAGFDTSGTFGTGQGRLLALRDRAVRRFYLRPSYLFRRATTLSGWEEFVIQFGEMAGMLKKQFLRTGGRA